MLYQYHGGLDASQSSGTVIPDLSTVIEPNRHDRCKRSAIIEPLIEFSLDLFPLILSLPFLSLPISALSLSHSISRSLSLSSDPLSISLSPHISFPRSLSLPLSFALSFSLIPVYVRLSFPSRSLMRTRPAVQSTVHDLGLGGRTVQCTNSAYRSRLQTLYMTV